MKKIIFYLLAVILVDIVAMIIIWLMDGSSLNYFEFLKYWWHLLFKDEATAELRIGNIVGMLLTQIQLCIGVLLLMGQYLFDTPNKIGVIN